MGRVGLTLIPTTSRKKFVTSFQMLRSRKITVANLIRELKELTRAIRFSMIANLEALEEIILQEAARCREDVSEQ